MNKSKWIRLKGGDGMAYKVQESRLWPMPGNAIAVHNPADSSLLFILPKAACEPCDPPGKWVDVTLLVAIDELGKYITVKGEWISMIPNGYKWDRDENGSLRIFRLDRAEPT